MTVALVFGRATTVWDEIKQAQSLTHCDYVLATGPSGAAYDGRLHAWVWFHIELFPFWIERRARNGYSPAESYWTIHRRFMRGDPAPGVPLQFVECEGGASGLIAVMVALDKFKTSHVILAGCPMTAEGGQYDTGQPWKEAAKHHFAWHNYLPKLQGRVKSLSGWTQELLGAPTTEWLQQVRAA